MTSLAPFRSSSFRWLWCSSLAFAGAQWMERVATGWLALEAGGSPLAVGIVFGARMVPALALGLASGTLADRVDRRRLLLVAGLLGALLAALLGTIVGVGSVALWQVAAIALANGTVQMLDVPARQALVVDTVGRPLARNAIALNAVATRFFGAVGALAGGLIIPLFGVAVSYYVVAASFLVAAMLIGSMRSGSTGQAAPADRPSFGRAFGDATNLIWRSRTIGTLVVASMTCEIFAFSYMSLVPTMARDVLLAGPEGLGVLNAAAALGATAAVVGLAALPATTRHESLLTAVYGLYGLSLVAFAASPSLVVATAAIAVTGACASAFDALQQTLIQLAVPEGQRGRAAGIWVFSIGTAPIGHLEAGALASTVGAPTALTLNGALVLAGAAWLAARSPQFRWRPAG